MKKLFLLCSFALLGSFSMANEVVNDNPEENKNSAQTEVAISECCTVTVEGGDGTATVTKCRTTSEEACNAAYAAAYTAAN